MNEEYLDMLRVYFECGHNSYQASQRYQQLYPSRDHPNRCKFQRSANNLRRYGAFKKPKRIRRQLRDENVELNVLLSVEEKQWTSVR
jgi:hypothetical protein